MKTWGWISAVLGVLSFIGALYGGSSPIGGLFFFVLGCYLIHRAKQNKQEQRQKDEWNNNGMNNGKGQNS